MMEIGIILIFSGITILSLILLLVTLLSFLKYKNVKLLFVSWIFFFMLLRGILLSLSIFNEEFAKLTSSGYIWIFDLIVLILLYMAYSIKRKIT